MVNYLYGYFCNKVTDRVEYFLKSEELIARAAEISLLLLLGRYEKFKEMYDKNEIDEVTLVRAVNETFSKTSYSNFRKSLIYCYCYWEDMKNLKKCMTRMRLMK
jgi:hypothetical protein